MELLTSMQYLDFEFEAAKKKLVNEHSEELAYAERQMLRIVESDWHLRA